MAKQAKSLPIFARLKQPSLMQRGQKRRQRGPEARQSTVKNRFYIFSRHCDSIYFDSNNSNMNSKYKIASNKFLWSESDYTLHEHHNFGKIKNA